MSRVFQHSSVKNANSANLFKRNKVRRKGETKNERLMEGIGEWTSFYRANPHRFVKEYLQLSEELKLFQQILLWAMMHNLYFAYIASRG